MRRIQETNDVWSFFFEPLSKISWEAGQSIRLELQRPTWGISERRFTIASAPHERYLQITTRLTGSEFKNLLAELSPGQEIAGHNIEGSFTWSRADTEPPILCIAAGIGITPFRALLLDAAQKNSLHDVVLLHRSKDNPPVFSTEFSHLSDDNTGFLYHQLISRLSEESVETIVPDWRKRMVYISGSGEMVRQVSKLFALLGLPPERIVRDIFTGNIS